MILDQAEQIHENDEENGEAEKVDSYPTDIKPRNNSIVGVCRYDIAVWDLVDLGVRVLFHNLTVAQV